MNRIDEKFKELRTKRTKAFIAYITAGDPNLQTTGMLIPALERSGVDIIELGIPFSDPLADGPVIQAASQRALQSGATVAKILKIAKKARESSSIPLVFMTYYNPVLRYGVDRFIRECKTSGIDGIIVPDLPYEESGDFARSCKRGGLRLILLVAPTSGSERIKKIAKRSKGFIYYVSLTGVTGVRKSLSGEIKPQVSLIKSMTDLPVCVGFGISNPAQAREAARVSDGVIVGSAIVSVIAKMKGNVNLTAKVSAYAKALAGAIHG